MKIQSVIRVSIILAISLVIFNNCKPKSKEVNAISKQNSNFVQISTPSYELVERFNGIHFEKFDSTITDENRFNYNNNIYKVNTTLFYTYEYYSKTGKQLLFEDQNNGQWTLTDVENESRNTILGISLKVLPGVSNVIKDYDETLAREVYIKNDRSKCEDQIISGLIENEMNVWLHPFREYLFSILETSPFPYIKAPIEIGNKWKWSLLIGVGWFPKEFKNIPASIENMFDYEITDTLTLCTKLGKIKCFKIEGVATNLIGKSYLTSYFNSKYGFVKLEYLNLDGSRIVLNLEEFSNSSISGISDFIKI